MATVTRKTEVESLDATPEKRMFWSIISDYDLETGLTELIDNSIDIWVANEKRQPLLVNLKLDVNQQVVELTDNAGGVSLENLRLLVTPGGSLNSPDAQSIGVFGVGSKRAVVAIAEQIAIKTCQGQRGSYQIDINKDWLESPDWEIPAYIIPEIQHGTTTVELSRLRKSFENDEIARLREHFGETYQAFLQDGQCSIQVNDEQVVPVSFENWAYPPNFSPRIAKFRISPSDKDEVEVEISSGLVRDRDPSSDNYGVYIYCNNRLIARALKTREVGYYISGEAGVPHPDASLCRAIVRLNGPAKLMPWNSSKTGVNYSHNAFVQIRPTLIQLISYFSSLSRRLKNDWPDKVFQYESGAIEPVPPTEAGPGKKLILPPLPRVQKSHSEQLRAKNKVQIEKMPWTLGLVEAVSAVDILARQHLTTGNRIALILLDSNFEIALKEFIVHRDDLFPGHVYTDSKIAEIFKSRHKVIQTVIDRVPIEAHFLERARHYYLLRNKLIHERATIGITQVDIDNYRSVIEHILSHLFGLTF